MVPRLFASMLVQAELENNALVGSGPFEPPAHREGPTAVAVPVVSLETLPRCTEAKHARGGGYSKGRPEAPTVVRRRSAAQFCNPVGMAVACPFHSVKNNAE